VGLSTGQDWRTGIKGIDGSTLLSSARDGMMTSHFTSDQYHQVILNGALPGMGAARTLANSHLFVTPRQLLAEPKSRRSHARRWRNVNPG
jgi:hypothetical protein